MPSALEAQRQNVLGDAYVALERPEDARNAYQQAQQKLGIFSPKTVTVSDLFVGALKACMYASRSEAAAIGAHQTTRHA